MTAAARADADLEELVIQAVAGDETAWQTLWRGLEPRLYGLVKQPRILGPLAQREDDCRGVVVEVMARLHSDGFRRLRLYLTTKRDNPGITFMPWLIVVAKRVAIDYLRAHPDYIDRRREQDASAPGALMNPGTLPSESQLGGARPPVTNRGTAQEILRYAAASIPDDQRRALELWIQNADHAEIAAQLGLARAADAERLVRAALERLRRYFRHPDGESPP